jgi:hypothetical protein
MKNKKVAKKKVSKPTMKKYFGVFSNRGIAVIQVLGDHKMPMIFQSGKYAKAVAETRTKQYKRKHFAKEVKIA